MDVGFKISDLGNFEKLIAPKVLKVIYWIGLVGIGLMALFSFFGALTMMQYSVGIALWTMIISVVGLCFGALFWRVMIEIYMVFFGIYERLGEIRDKK